MLYAILLYVKSKNELDLVETNNYNEITDRNIVQNSKNYNNSV